MKKRISGFRGLLTALCFVAVVAAHVDAVTFFDVDVANLVQLDNDSYCLNLSLTYDAEWQTLFAVNDGDSRVDAASILKLLSVDSDAPWVANLGFPGDPDTYSENYDPGSGDRTTAIFAADWRFETLPTNLLYYFDYSGAASTVTFDYYADFVRGTLYSSQTYGDWYESQPEAAFRGSFTVNLPQVAQIPEPATVMMMVGGLATLVAVRRRRR